MWMGKSNHIQGATNSPREEEEKNSRRKAYSILALLQQIRQAEPPAGERTTEQSDLIFLKVSRLWWKNPLGKTVPLWHVSTQQADLAALQPHSK